MSEFLMVCGWLFIVCVVIAVAMTVYEMIWDYCLCARDERMNRAYSNGQTKGYITGCNDTERRMQNEAVRYGGARWEGDNQEFFVWQNLNQRFPRVR